MAGRFSNLEFDEDRNEKPVQPKHAFGAERDGWRLLADARSAHCEGQHEIALQLYTRALQEDRTLIRAWVGQVQMLVQLGEFHEARVWSDKALQLFKNNGDLMAAKAQAVIRLKDKKGALACSDGSMQAPGSSAFRWEARGEVLMARGDGHFDLCFQKALEEPDADWFDRVLIGRIYRYYRKTASAMRYLHAALEIAPVHSYAWFELGACQQELGLLGAAQTSYERCLELKTDFREADVALRSLSSISFGQWVRSVLRRWRKR